MTNIHPEYVIDSESNPTPVVLPITEWNAILEELEELDDIREYDKAKSTPQESEQGKYF